MRADLHEANFLASYLDLGHALQGTAPFKGQGFEGYLSYHSHPLSNVAICTGPTVDARHLQSVAADHVGLRVYDLSATRTEERQEALLSVGFVPQQEMLLMGCDCGQAIEGETVEPQRAEGRKRFRIGVFISEQFFVRQDRTTINQFSRAIMVAESQELYYLQNETKIAAAFLLNPTQGVLGLYSLCVAGEARRRGLGSKLVRWVRADAERRGLEVGFQCSPSLQPWYARLGFAVLGDAQVFTLSRS